MPGTYSQEFVHRQVHERPYIFEQDFIQQLNQPLNFDDPEPFHHGFDEQDFHNLLGAAYGQSHDPTVWDAQQHPSKRLRTDNPEQPQTFSRPPFTRATTPEGSPPPRTTTPTIYDFLNNPGGFSSTLAAATPIPPNVTPRERRRRETAVTRIFTSTQSSLLPPPSPRDRTASTPAPFDPKLFRVRLPPAEVTLAPLLPRAQLARYIRVEDIPEGPRKDAARAHNNALAAQKLREQKRRNNLAAGRSRGRKERAIVGRSDELAWARAETSFWKAVAVAGGACPRAWDVLDPVVREGLAADNRFDAMDFGREEEKGEGTVGTVVKETAKRKRKRAAEKE
ncbi:hypothetical protein CCHL11_01030 [Colletotrichum chlorophyti]|uniref:BZIP domain-containing protein n=1 Tax=Colletotrichum chlorophyti TaxID=708187 RepID=A0A1Q8S7M9_9PEZI|nr:hypothetical protein CCHL11_01030 [Colletotrichum chlorophyti]